MPKGVYTRTEQWHEAVKRGNAAKEISGKNNPNWRGGKTKHYLYWIYQDMVRRCTKPNHPRYADYGGRGITICDEWAADFWQFVKDMGDRPSRSHSLDRIDNNKGYEPSNCRWATRSEQAQNKRGFGPQRRDPTTGQYR